MVKTNTAKTIKPAPTRVEISPALTATVIGAVVLIIAIAAFLTFRSLAASTARVNVPPAVVQQNQQFMATLEGMAPSQRQAYLGQNMEQWDEFRMTASTTQMAEFAKCMSGQ